jgi:hypothetical protein
MNMNGMNMGGSNGSMRGMEMGENYSSEGLHFDAKPGEYDNLRLVNTRNMTHLLTI